MRSFITLVENAVTRQWIALLENNNPLGDLSDLDLSSYEAFTASLKIMPKGRLHELNGHLTAFRESAKAPLGGLTKLYHGTASNIADSIHQSGFKLGKGTRSTGGLLGSNYQVDNQGIFLTDNPKLANFFGGNRAPSGFRVIPCYVDTSRVVDFSAIPLPIRKQGLGIVNSYYGTSSTRIPRGSWWWLLDRPEFVALLREQGFSGVRFKEDISVRRVAKDAVSYLIFDPSTIHTEQSYGRTIRDFYDWLREQ